MTFTEFSTYAGRWLSSIAFMRIETENGVNTMSYLTAL